MKSRLLESLQAPPARRRTQAHALGEFLVGQARIALQLLQDAAVGFVEIGHMSNDYCRKPLGR